jgi:hypothetical protein
MPDVDPHEGQTRRLDPIEDGELADERLAPVMKASNHECPTSSDAAPDAAFDASLDALSHQMRLARLLDQTHQCHVLHGSPIEIHDFGAYPNPLCAPSLPSLFRVHRRPK